MNQQDQIDIIKAHMAGKKVLRRFLHNGDEPVDTWVELAKQYHFDFQHCEYKIEPRKLELFMALPSGVFQALGREPSVSHNAWVGNEPPHQMQPGHVIVKIHCTEPEN